MIGRFLLEYCLLDLNYYNIQNSLIAASIIHIINRLYGRDADWYFE